MPDDFDVCWSVSCDTPHMRFSEGIAMRKRIIEKLNEIERTEGVTVLYAAESGSRAWGFASPDSDYDIRFLYLRREEDYLRIERPRDVIELPIDGPLDVNGWDVQKALRLLHKSNPALFEWSASPIVYRSTPAWEGLRPLMGRCFSCRSGVHHYLHMAAGNYREYLKGERVRTKKCLYVIRPILACLWIVEHSAPPPMPFDELRAMADPELQPIIDGLLEVKRRSPEAAWGPRIDALNRWIEAELSRLPQAAEALPKGEPPSMEELEAAFLTLLRGQGR